MVVGPENGNFPLLYVLKMSLRRGVGGSKKAQTPLRNIKMVPKRIIEPLKTAEKLFHTTLYTHVQLIH